jgi:hypothetical protein
MKSVHKPVWRKSPTAFHNECRGSTRSGFFRTTPNLSTREAHCPVAGPGETSNQDGAPMSQLKVHEAMVNRARQPIENAEMRSFAFRSA